MTRTQLLAAGVTPAEIKHRLASGSFLPVHRGIYRVGHPAPSREATYLAAVLACGVGASLAGRSAGHLLGLVTGRVPAPEVVVRNWRRVPGVATRRSRVDPEEITIWLGIPVTTVPRTLVDLAGVLSPDALARACHEAGVRYGTTPRQVEVVLDRRPNALGAGRLRAVLGGETRVTLSRLERHFLQLLTEEGLPLPQANRSVDGRRVDCRWPERRLTVELDSYRFHNSRHAWEQDHRRERAARARSDDFRRFTSEDVFEHPRPMLAELRPLLVGARATLWSQHARPEARRGR